MKYIFKKLIVFKFREFFFLLIIKDVLFIFYFFKKIILCYFRTIIKHILRVSLETVF